jgi:hypothetical protein
LEKMREAGYGTQKKQQAEPTADGGKLPDFAVIPQNGGVLGAEPLGEGETEDARQRGCSEGETSPFVGLILLLVIIFY